jgi:hypothetical protein
MLAKGVLMRKIHGVLQSATPSQRAHFRAYYWVLRHGFAADGLSLQEDDGRSPPT